MAEVKRGKMRGEGFRGMSGWTKLSRTPRIISPYLSLAPADVPCTIQDPTPLTGPHLAIHFTGWGVQVNYVGVLILLILITVVVLVGGAFGGGS